MIIREVGIGFGLLNAMRRAKPIRTASAAKKYQRGIAGPLGLLIVGEDVFGAAGTEAILLVVVEATLGVGAAATLVVGAAAEPAPCINVRTPAAIGVLPF